MLDPRPTERPLWTSAITLPAFSAHNDVTTATGVSI